VSRIGFAGGRAVLPGMVMWDERGDVDSLRRAGADSQAHDARKHRSSFC
jgi:hypothetical protein